MVMKKSKCKTQRSPSTTSSTSNQYFLPYDVILYTSKYLDFQDYRGFIRVFWLNGEEDVVVRDILWHKSIHKFESTFFNGKNAWKSNIASIVQEEGKIVFLSIWTACPNLYSAE